MDEKLNSAEPRLSNRNNNELDQQKLEELFNTYDKSSYEKGFLTNPHSSNQT